MRESYLKLLSVAEKFSVFFCHVHFEVFLIEDGTHVDILTPYSLDPGQVIEMAEGLRVNLYPAGDNILVRVYEK